MRKTIFYPAIFFTSLLFVNACQTESAADMMIGNWQAFQFVEAGDSVKINPSEINFTFDQNGRYYFKSTLNYQEAGTFKTEEKVLFTTDTLSNVEKAVGIQKLNQDTLILEMNQANKSQVLSLKRIN